MQYVLYNTSKKYINYTENKTQLITTTTTKIQFAFKLYTYTYFKWVLVDDTILHYI